MAVHVDHYRASWGGVSSDRTIAPVPSTGRAFVVVYGSARAAAAQRSNRWAHAAELVNATTVRLMRTEPLVEGDAESSFAVVWCDAGEFRVSQVSFGMVLQSQQDVAIPGAPFDPDRTMVLVSSTCFVALAENDRFAHVTAALLNGSTVRFSRGTGAETLTAGMASTAAHAFVVEWSGDLGVTVERGTDTLDVNLSEAVTVPYSVEAVNRTLVIWQARHESHGLEQTSVQCQLTEDGRAYRRHTTTTAWRSWVHWQAIQFPEARGVRVGRGDEEIAGATAAQAIESDLTELPAGLVLLTASCAGIGTTTPRHLWWVDATSAGVATIERGWTGNAARVSAQFADLAALTLPPVEPDEPEGDPGHRDEEEAEDRGKDVVARERNVVRFVLPAETYLEWIFGEEALV